MMEKFQKHISFFEKATAIVVGLLLLLCIITQIFFEGDVLLLIAILTVCELIFSYLVFWPETYEFRDASLAIVTLKQRVRKEIPYCSVFDLETVGRFRDAKKDFDTVEILLTYVPTGKKMARSVSCHPKNVHGFVKELRLRCPNLSREDS